MSTLIDKKLRNLQIGTCVELSYVLGSSQQENIRGVVTDNDFRANVEITSDQGEQIIVNYTIVCGVQFKKSAPTQEFLYQKEPEDLLKLSDFALKEEFDRLPQEDKGKLSNVFESFKYGLKINDRQKMEDAANQARQILYREEDLDYRWSAQAARFCGCLLRRNGVSDYDVLLAGECMSGAASAAWREQEYVLAGAYAVAAILEEDTKHLDMLVHLLAASIVRADDASGLRVLHKYLPTGYEPYLKTLIREAFAAKGVRTSAEQTIAAALETLVTLYPGTEMEKKAINWLPLKLARKEQTASEKAASPAPARQEAQVKAAPVAWRYGRITRLNWSEESGVISDSDGKVYSFAYGDLEDGRLNTQIRNLMRSDLDGGAYFVRFAADGSRAKKVRGVTDYVDRARVFTTTRDEQRFELAYGMCKKALEIGNDRRALGDLIRYAISLYTQKQEIASVTEALELYEGHTGLYPANAFAELELAQCYGYVNDSVRMLEHAEKAMTYRGLSLKQKIATLSFYLRTVKDRYDLTGERALLERICTHIQAVKTEYAAELGKDAQVHRQFIQVTVPYSIIANCALDMLEEAEADYATLPENHTMRSYLTTLLYEARARLRPAAQPAPEPEVPAVSVEEQLPLNVRVNTVTILEEVPAVSEEAEEQEIIAEAEEKEIVPYNDADGWEALKLTKQEVVDYALGITGEGRCGAMLAYLLAGAELNGDIRPVYHSVALAADDPMESPDYSPTSLITALAAGDTDYPELHELCMGAAFLRSSFLYGRDYDYCTRALRDSLAIEQRLDALRDVCDTLEQFRREVGCPVDIYADYRNHGVKKLKADLEQTISHAEELYTKFVLTPPRDAAKFLRILRTKQIVFARDGYLAVMLRLIAERDQEGLEAQKNHFAASCLKGSGPFAGRSVSSATVEQIIESGWEEAGKTMQVEKANASLQGERRNNMRSGISEILNTILRWYVLSEQDAGITWRTEQGDLAYQRLCPVLMEQLERLAQVCEETMLQDARLQVNAGMFLLARTARELHARLDGSWRFEQRKFLYADFLRSGHVMLREDFMPDLSSTFCALPRFNILARIRSHVEEPRRSFQAQIDQIYGPDAACGNYGTANQIAEYLEFTGESDAVTFPEHQERYAAHAGMQTDIRYRSFLETYALAMNYGQIIKSDAFCYTLEDTVRYWNHRCRADRSYGFFNVLLMEAESQIHASARQYEEQLEKQLKALVSRNKAYFDDHPGYDTAILDQITNQNFTVAEDWMARIRIGDFSLEVQQPEALEYLERFFSTKYIDIYHRVADASRSLGSILGRREVRSKDTKLAQQLIDNWLNNGHPSNTERIGQLLNLLGWQNIRVSQYHYPLEPRTEIYEIRTEVDASVLTAPLHPIAAFGSGLERRPMYVVCLYGVYNCDRIYEKMRTLDGITGSKIILLDYALSQTDRRTLARKLKKRKSGMRNVNMIIDRVLITYLADNYNENLINRVLMATAMPFTYCQPYVVESVHTMPPEIFIGRKDELLRIEQPDGVNLIYGGRQLGKSALFKKALSDLDGRRNQRAVLVDIKELDCAAAARKVSTKLIDLNITPDAQITDDWDVLCRNIERRLRSKEDEISYFLLMLDEADTFIDDCAGCGYRPLVALKDVQQSLPSCFKYVLAGLHNIVKFNRQVALGRNSVITHMPSLKITPFRNPEAQELLTGPLSYLGFSLPSKVTVSQILATCNYFPGLIQLYAKKLVESVQDADYAGYDIKKTPPYMVSDEHLRRVMSDKDFVDQIHEKFEITLTLDQDQGSSYYPLALLIGWMCSVCPSQSGYTARDVLNNAKDLCVSSLKDMDEEKIDALLQELQDLNVLRSIGHNSYLLASKNFKDLLGSDEEIFEKLMKVGGVGA